MARAQRFYGGLPSYWLHLPIADLNEMVDAANILESQERLRAIADGQVAAGVMKKEPRAAHMRHLERASQTRRAKPQASASDVAALAAVGIKVNG